MNAARLPPRVWLALLLSALVLRLGVLALHEPWDDTTFRSRNLQGDAVEYHRLAVHLAAGRGFVQETRDGAALRPEALRTPPYPGFVAAAYRVFGPDFLAPILAQLALALVTLAFLVAWCERELGSRAALAAGLVFGLDPDLAHLNVTLWSETLFLAMAVPALFAWRRAMAEPGLPWAALAGLGLGLAAFVRPAALGLPVLAAITVAATALGPHAPTNLPPGVALRARARPLLAALVLLLVAGAALAPWTLRNQRVFGVAALSSSAGWNLLHVHAARLLAATEGVDAEAAAARLEVEVERRTGAARDNPLRRSQTERRVALEVLAARPIESLRYQLAGMATLLLSPGRSRWQTSLGRAVEPRPVARAIVERGWVRGLGEAARGDLAFTGLAMLRVLTLLALYALAGYGLVRLARHGRTALWGPLLAFALYAVVVAGPLGDSRFRVVLLPSLALLAGAGWDALRARRDRAGATPAVR